MVFTNIDIRKDWQERKPLLDAVANVLEILGVTEESNPRLQKAAYIYAGEDNRDEIEKVFGILQKFPALPVVIIGWWDLKTTVQRDPTISPLLRFPNVRFVQTATNGIEQLFYLFKNPKIFSINVSDHIEGFEVLRGRFRHDLGHALRGDQGYDQAAIIRAAREQLKLEIDDESVIARVMESRKEFPEVSKYSDFPAACADWEGTLFQQGKFSQEVFARAREMATAENVPLVIWTGGDVDKIYGALLELGIKDVEVCSKHDCRGLRAKAIIDDEDPEFLRREYGFDFGRFKYV